MRVFDAGERVFEAAEKLARAVEAEEALVDAGLGDDMNLDLRARWRLRRLDKVDSYVDHMTRSVVDWGAEAGRIESEQPTGAWQKRRQLRRLKSIARYVERAADRIGRIRP